MEASTIMAIPETEVSVKPKRRRFSASEKLRVKLNSSFDFQRRCLPRWRVMTNLLAGCGVMTAQRVWRKLRRLPTDDVKITQQMYSIELKRAMKRNHS